jgi:murein DD-endopeptidase MepM/ murein hydrolase activator NlpD
MIRIRPLIAVLSLLALAACAEEQGVARLSPVTTMSMSSNAEAGESVQVQPGDTVYSLARRYKVSMRDVIALNNLQPPFSLQPGASVVLPAKQIMMAPKKQLIADEPQPNGILQPAQDPGSVTYHQVAESELDKPQTASYDPQHQQVMQAMARDPSPMRTLPQPTPQAGNSGMFVPANSIQAQPIQPMAAQPPMQIIQPQPEMPPAPPLQMVVMQPPQQQVAVAPPAQPAPPVFPKKMAITPAVTSSPSGRFIWPVHGKVISEFGSQSGGMRNDGINISAPRGTPVAASDGGTVAYAGSDIPGYGNVVLIRHPDGYMTTYAHLERIFVQPDSVAAKGDVIGTVGTTGGLVTPQLHFEIRKGSDAVAPKKYMAKL